MLEKVDERDDIEDDWEILRRDPRESAFPTTISMAEAVERICKALVDYECSGVPEETRRDLMFNNKFPVLSVVPYYDVIAKKHLWKVLVAFEAAGLNYASSPSDCCEQAVEELFRMISVDIDKKAKELTAQADISESEANTSRDQARKIRRISTSMGSYSLVQPNLPI